MSTLFSVVSSLRSLFSGQIDFTLHASSQGKDLFLSVFFVTFRLVVIFPDVAARIFAAVARSSVSGGIYGSG